jgi:hypothetical protein
MENIQLLRNIAMLEQRLRMIEISSGGMSSTSVDLSDFTARLAAVEARPVVDLNDVSSRLAAVEARPVVDLNDVSSRLAAVEARPVVDLNDVSSRLASVEARPELSQRLSALELAVTSINSN